MSRDNAIEKIKIDLKEEKRDYEIVIGGGLLDSLAEYIGRVYAGKKIFSGQ